jgi:filamentous hemagglutinin family protein
LLLKQGTCYQYYLVFRPTIVAFLALIARSLFAGGPGGVVLDGSFGTSGSLPGPSFMIPANVGRQIGGNLFHSFSQFDLNSTQSATFTGPSNVHNILSRVTGGSASSIDGLVRSDIAGANLFLLNPSGVMFGPHAQIDVTGSFAVSTANYVKLASGGRFSTSLGGQDLLTSAPVTAFGFLNVRPAPVSITGDLASVGGHSVAAPILNVAARESFSIVAGSITTGSSRNSFDQTTQIRGEGSRVNLVSVGSPGEVQLNPTDINSAVVVSEFTELGEIDLNNVGIDTSGVPGGQISIYGSKLFMKGCSLISGTPVLSPRTPIAVVASENVSLLLFGLISTSMFSSSVKGNNIAIKTGSLTVNDSEITTTTEGFSNTEVNVLFEADSLTLRDSIVSASSPGEDGANSVVVKVKGALMLVGFSSIFTHASEEESSKAGNLLIEAGSLTIDATGEERGFLFDRGSAAAIFSYSAGSGDSGDVTINIDGTLSLRAGAGISSETFSAGNGGKVTVEARSILIDGTGSNLNTGISARASNIRLTPSRDHIGNAGDVIVETGDLTIRGGAKISSSTFARGTGGSIGITADSLLIDGATSGVFAQSHTSAPAGSVRLVLGTLSMDSGSSISSANTGTGSAGSVFIHTIGSMELSDGSNVSTSSIVGNAGDVSVQTVDLTITDGAQLSSNTFGRGNGGNVSVFADSVFIDSGSSNLLTGITADAEAGSSGNAGNVIVHASDLTIAAGGELSSNTFGQGNGGNVTVTARSILIDGMGSDLSTGISARASNIRSNPLHLSIGNAGNIIVGAENLTITGGGKISSSTFAQGNGGTVSVTADSLLIDGATSGIFAASLTSAPAGSVRLVLGTLSMDSGSSISSANSGSGSAGNVIIDTLGPVKLRHGSTISTFSRLADAGSIQLSSDGVIALTGQSSITASAVTRGGNIDIRALDLVYLIDSSITAEAGNTGGNITIDNAQFVVLNNSIISANAAIGQGGNIDLLSDFFFNSGSLITATGITNNGTVNIAAPELDLSAALVTLPSSLLSAETQLRERCTAQLRGDFSSFITVGRGSTEPAPDELQVEF